MSRAVTGYAANARTERREDAREPCPRTGFPDTLLRRRQAEDVGRGREPEAPTTAPRGASRLGQARSLVPESTGSPSEGRERFNHPLPPRSCRDHGRSPGAVPGSYALSAVLGQGHFQGRGLLLLANITG